MRSRVRWFVLGIVITMVGLVGGAYLFVTAGGVSLDTTAPPLPFERMLAPLEFANLQGAHLEGAHLEGTYLHGAHLASAYLQKTNLQGARLVMTHLEGAHLEGAHLKGLDLRVVIGLTSAQLQAAQTNEHTQLPDDLKRPAP
jgi:hypothetical protein